MECNAINTNSWLGERVDDKDKDFVQSSSGDSDAGIISGGDAIGDTGFVVVWSYRWKEDRVIGTTHKGGIGGGNRQDSRDGHERSFNFWSTT